MRRQIALAKLYGIFGFVFYFYWFNGKRLLEKPLLNYLGDSQLDLPFCLCWANESWTRRWDGREKDVLLAQHHSADDDIRFIAHIAKYLRDPRYVRVCGRALVIVYRPDLLPDPKATARRWRDWCLARGIGELYLVYTQSFESRPPAEYGMDAALEFPPNNSGAPDITSQVPHLDPDFSGTVFDWSVFPMRSRNYIDPGYVLFRGITTTWDNEARRPGRGAVFAGASPEGYREWLENAIKDTEQRFSEPSERLIFVNAWNEWAEGAHLEPDSRYGFAFLQATREALERAEFGLPKPILLVVHDAQRNGAQLLALSIARTLTYVFGYRVHLLLLEEGPLLSEFRRVGPVTILRAKGERNKEASQIARLLWSKGVRGAIVNSTASGLIVPALREAGLQVTSLIHELPGVIARSKLEKHARIIGEFADTVVFPSNLTLEGFGNFGSITRNKVVIRPQGLYKRCSASASRIRRARSELRERNGLTAAAQIVLGVGYGDERKGFDLFAESCCQMAREAQEAVFIWVGDCDPTLAREAYRLVDLSACSSKLVLTGYQAQTDDFFLGADVFALTSREDPFPSVVLEAFDAGLQVVAFDAAVGLTEITDEAPIKLVPAFDVEEFSAAIASSLHSDSRRRRETAERARSVIKREFGFRRYVWDLLAFFSDSPPRVSAILLEGPSQDVFEDSLRAITRQSVPVYEMIVITDPSGKAGSKSADGLLHSLDPEAQRIPIAAFEQEPLQVLLHAAELARGELLWLAAPGNISGSTLLQAAIAKLCQHTQTGERPCSLDLNASIKSSVEKAVASHSLCNEPLSAIYSLLAVQVTSTLDCPMIVAREWFVDTLRQRLMRLD